jgi:hypothetical protein
LSTLCEDAAEELGDEAGVAGRSIEAANRFADEFWQAVLEMIAANTANNRTIGLFISVFPDCVRLARCDNTSLDFRAGRVASYGTLIPL